MLAELTTRPQTPAPVLALTEWGDEPGVVARARTQDRDAFGALYERYSGQIYNYVYRLMGNSEAARDLTADAFVKMWLSIPKTSADLRFRPWAFKVATNVCLDELRHRKLVKWQPWDAFVSAFHPSQVAKDSPERECIQVEDTEEVRLILERLLPKYRLCLVLREYHELSYDEIAEVLQTTRAAVKSLLYRARDEFRLLYAKTARQPGAPRRTAPAPRAYGGREATPAADGDDDFTAYRREYKNWHGRCRRGSPNPGPKPLLRNGRLVFEGAQECATEGVPA